MEQTSDFLKDPVQIRLRWLHSAKRLAGLALLLLMMMMAALVEHQGAELGPGDGATAETR